MGLDKISIYKKELGLTNEQLAELSGVPKSTIDKITAGTTYDPKYATIVAIAKALGRSVNDFDDYCTSCESAKEYQPNALTITDEKDRELMVNYKELIPDNQAYIRVRIRELLKEQLAEKGATDTEVANETA